jgi:hypothetical protein
MQKSRIYSNKQMQEDLMIVQTSCGPKTQNLNYCFFPTQIALLILQM